MRIASLFLISLCLIFAVVPATAQVLYNNGPINGQTDGWTINLGFGVANSFFLTSASQVTGLTFGAWVTPGDVLQSAEVSIVSDPTGGGQTYFDGLVNFTQSGCFLNSYSYDVCTETGNFGPVNLIGGTYYLVLQNAVSTEGNPVYWDENSGVGCDSPGCPSDAHEYGRYETIPSEAFTVLGNNGDSTVPEPGSLAMFASGVVLAGSWARRRLGSRQRSS
jgi:hypothetical protein